MKILVINAGSSSLKFELFEMPERTVVANGLLQRIGEEQSELRYSVEGRQQQASLRVADHSAGLRLIMDRLVDSAHGGLADVTEIGAVGHRVVHGGEAFVEPALITDEVVQVIQDHEALAPLHNPPNLLGIEVARALLPGIPQVAVFDTAFHQSMPAHAYTYALPIELYREHRVRRYGFHGTSHRYVTLRAAELLGRPLDAVNLITCHLGNGASVAAVKGGRAVDTSMGLTPLEGLVMGTRCGDIDPAIIFYLERAAKMTGAEIDKLLNKKSGLLGLSGISNDVRTLLQAEADGDQQARLALEIYCYRVKKYIGAYTAALGEVSAVVLTAGVGENAASIRERILDGMGPLGYRLDPAKNREARGKELDVAAADSPVRILVIPTDEELMIALDAYEIASKPT
jgi:acetate kinase